MNIKKLCCLTILVWIILSITGCHLFEDEQKLLAPEIQSHSIGNNEYFPYISLYWSGVDGAENYELVRSAPDDGAAQFVDVGKWDNHDWYEDSGWNAPMGELIPGHTYIYKTRAHANGPGFGSYSAEYSVYIPAFRPPENLTAVPSDDGESVILQWDAVEDGDTYEIYRSVSATDWTSTRIGTTASTLYTDNDSLDPALTYYYWVKTVSYSWGTTDFSEPTHNAFPPAVEYTWTDLGTVASNTEGFAPDAFAMAADSSTGKIYIGYVKDTATAGVRTAGAVVYNGASWQASDGNTGDISPDLTGVAPYSETISLAAGGDALYLSTMDENGVYIYMTSGADWSANLAGTAFTGAENQPAITYSGSSLHAAWIQGDGNIAVLQWDGNDTTPGWSVLGGPLSSSGTVSNFHLADIAGTLYLVYTEDMVADPSYQDRVTVKHWNGSAWLTDLEWDRNYLGPVEITGNGTDIYIHCVSAYQSEFPEGVYRIESASSAVRVDQNLGTAAIASDGEGKLIMTSVGLEGIVPWGIRVYDGTTISAIEGDYSNFEKPGALAADDTTIYAAYGAKDSLLITNSYPAAIGVVVLTP